MYVALMTTLARNKFLTIVRQKCGNVYAFRYVQIDVHGVENVIIRDFVKTEERTEHGLLQNATATCVVRSTCVAFVICLQAYCITGSRDAEAIQRPPGDVC